MQKDPNNKRDKFSPNKMEIPEKSQKNINK